MRTQEVDNFYRFLLLIRLALVGGWQAANFKVNLLELVSKSICQLGRELWKKLDVLYLHLNPDERRFI